MFSTVSVPYRGATFLNNTSIKSHVQQIERPFPSPIGELHFSIEMKKCIMKGAFGFPSPIGELHFSIVDGSDDQIMRIVSVPYRGATFLNNYDKDYLHKNHRFRPLSGSYISQSEVTQPLPESIRSFRPLSGSYISQLCICGRYYIKSGMVSVPYRGATFLNCRSIVS